MQALYVQVAEWVGKAWEKVTTETVKNSFRCTGITGSKADLHNKLKRIVDDAAMDPLDAQSETVSDGEEELEIDDEDSGLFEEDEGNAIIQLGLYS